VLLCTCTISILNFTRQCRVTSFSWGRKYLYGFQQIYSLNYVPNFHQNRLSFIEDTTDNILVFLLLDTVYVGIYGTCRCNCAVSCKRSSGTRQDWTMKQLRTVTLSPLVNSLDGRAMASACRRTVRGHRRYHCRYLHCTRVSLFMMQLHMADVELFTKF